MARLELLAQQAASEPAQTGRWLIGEADPRDRENRQQEEVWDPTLYWTPDQLEDGRRFMCRLNQARRRRQEEQQSSNDSA